MKAGLRLVPAGGQDLDGPLTAAPVPQIQPRHLVSAPIFPCQTLFQRLRGQRRRHLGLELRAGPPVQRKNPDVLQTLDRRFRTQAATPRADPHPQPVGRAQGESREPGSIHVGLHQLRSNPVTRLPVVGQPRQHQTQRLGNQIGAVNFVANEQAGQTDHLAQVAQPGRRWTTQSTGRARPAQRRRVQNPALPASHDRCRSDTAVGLPTSGASPQGCCAMIKSFQTPCSASSCPLNKCRCSPWIWSARFGTPCSAGSFRPEARSRCRALLPAGREASSPRFCSLRNATLALDKAGRPSGRYHASSAQASRARELPEGAGCCRAN